MQRDDHHYIPILKGRQGELDALGNIGPERDGLTPLLEVVPTGIDEFDPAQAEQDLRRFAERLASRWRPDQRVIVDAGYFAQSALSEGLFPIEYLAQEVRRREMSATPTVRPSDLEVTLEACRGVVQGDPERGVCIRLGSDDLDDEEAPLADTLEFVLGELGVRPSNADLVLDFGALPDDSGARLAARMARYLLAELPDIEEWRTLTLAAGAFPAGLSSVPAGVFGAVPRADWAFWQEVRSRTRVSRRPGFGDYGIAHPAVAQGVAFAPAPQIRYTADDDWLILRGRRGVRRGAQQFYDICARLTDRPEYSGPTFSWGDRRIQEAAESAPEGAEPLVGPGNASTWRSIGTSHHLAFVVSRLATLA